MILADTFFTTFPYFCISSCDSSREKKKGFSVLSLPQDGAKSLKIPKIPIIIYLLFSNILKQKY